MQNTRIQSLTEKQQQTKEKSYELYLRPQDSGCSICKHNIFFLCDCRSPLQTIRDEQEDQVTRTVNEQLNQLSFTNNVTLKWIPVHYNVGGNETADKFAETDK